MRVTNNRAKNAWFKYKINGMPKSVFVGAYKTITIPELHDVNDITSKRTVTNFSQTTVPSNNALSAYTDVTSVIVPDDRLDSVEKLGQRDKKVTLTVDQQTKLRWEIEW